MKTFSFLFYVLAVVIISSGMKDAQSMVIDSPNTSIANPAPAVTDLNPNNASFSATFDGKAVEVTDSNRWSGVALGGVANDGETKIQTINITTYGKNHSGYVISFDRMDGKTGTTNNASAIVNLPGESYGGKKGGNSVVKITKAEQQDAKHFLYSGEFEIDCAKIGMDPKTYVLKGKFENYLVLVPKSMQKGQ